MDRNQNHPGLNRDMANDQKTNIFWTGGWDSTFRLISLILANKGEIQPYYIINYKDRASTRVEIKCMDRIRKIVYRKYPWAGTNLLPTEYINVEDIESNEALNTYYKNLRARAWYGTQYGLLSRFAEQSGVKDIELTVEKETSIHKLLKGSIDKIVNGDEHYYKLSPLVQDKDLLLFKYFKFPLFDVSKIEMETIARKLGFLYILDKTWFCHRPLIMGLSCGTCNTCTYAMEEGMARRVSLVGKARYYLKLLLLKPGESKIYRGGNKDNYKILRRTKLSQFYAKKN